MPHAALPIVRCLTHIIALLGETKAHLHQLERCFSLGEKQVLLASELAVIVLSCECIPFSYPLIGIDNELH